MPLNKPPCPITITCPGSDTPISNFSSEDPDLVQFSEVSFPFYNPSNPFGDSNTPAPGGLFSAEGCAQVCYSAKSQEAANLCAAVQAFQCDTSQRQTPPTLFYNAVQQCCIICPDGATFCWTVPAGSFVSTSQVLANRVASEYACQQAAANILCLPAMPGACLNEPFYQNIFIPTKSPPLIFEVAGNLPPGLIFTITGANSAVLAGTPTVPGTYDFTIQVIDSNQEVMVKNYIFNVMDVDLSTLPQPSAGTPYNAQITPIGASLPVTFTVVGGALPDGLSLSADGLLTGTPSKAGTFPFTLLVQDAAGNTCTFAVSLTVKGVDWSQLLWFTQAQNLPGITPNPSPDGSASFTPFGSKSASFTFATFSGTQPSEQSQSFNSGDLTYNGPASNCKLTIQLQQTGPAAQTISEVTVSDKFGGSFFFDTGHLPTVNGTYTFLFTVPDTGGLPITIEVFATMVSASGNPVNASSLNITGTLSNA